MTFGEKIQSLRKSRGWSQERLAEQIDVTRQALSKWENGTAVPDTANVIRLARLFEVSTDYLLIDECVDSRPMQAAPSSVQPAERGYPMTKLLAWALICVGGLGLLGTFLWSLDSVLIGNADTLFGFIRELVIGLWRVLQYRTERMLFGGAAFMVMIGTVILLTLKFYDDSE